jgi:uncharacterized phosphosugar-binding protein
VSLNLYKEDILVNLVEEYYYKINQLITKFKDEEVAEIKRAAKIIAQSIKNDELIHIFGTGGHSYMAAEELFYRAGGLVPINPVFDGGVTVANGAERSTNVERTTGYASAILTPLHLENYGSIIIISNVYGINSVTIESALFAKERGMKVIAVTSIEHAKNLPQDAPSRHPSKKNLYEIADITLDVPVPVGDAVLELEGLDVNVSPCSTILVSFCLNALVAETIQELINMGIDPPVWKSANSPGGDEYIKKYKDKYRTRIKYL